MTREQEMQFAAELLEFCSNNKIRIKPVIDNANKIAEIYERNGGSISNELMARIQFFQLIFKIASL